MAFAGLACLVQRGNKELWGQVLPIAFVAEAKRKT